MRSFGPLRRTNAGVLNVGRTDRVLNNNPLWRQSWIGLAIELRPDTSREVREHCVSYVRSDDRPSSIGGAQKPEARWRTRLSARRGQAPQGERSNNAPHFVDLSVALKDANNPHNSVFQQGETQPTEDFIVCNLSPAGWALRRKGDRQETH
jgi:hypothetical protein